MGCNPRKLVDQSPSIRAKKILMAKIQDEAGHDGISYCAAETLGVKREDVKFIAIGRKG